LNILRTAIFNFEVVWAGHAQRMTGSCQKKVHSFSKFSWIVSVEISVAEDLAF